MQQSIIEQDFYEFKEKAKLIQQKTDLFFSLFKNDFPSLEVKESNVHGKGVFACEDIEPWTITTVYPTTYVFANHESEKDFFLTSKRSYNELYKYAMCFAENDDINTNPRYTIKISGDPTILNSGLGHMLNDAGMMNELTLEQYQSYAAANTNKTNCMFYHMGNGVNVIMSIKPIKKGEEMFLWYGMPYWFKGNSWSLAWIKYKEISFHLSKLLLIRKTICKEKLKKVKMKLKFLNIL